MSRSQPRPIGSRIGYGCLVAVILVFVPAASFAVVFLWNVNLPH